jgi:hypothetical protein
MTDDAIRFDIVPDSYRRPERTWGRYKPIIDALSRGETVFLPGITGAWGSAVLARLYNEASKRRVSLRTARAEIGGNQGRAVWFQTTDDR